MERRTRVSATKNGRKKQIPRTPEQEAEAIRELARGVNEAIRELARGVNEAMDTFHAEMTLTMSKAKLAQTLARTELIKTAQGLLGKARNLAERGRPRLLAVVAKIILDRNLQFEAPGQRRQIPTPATPPRPTIQ
jgi:AmiR/NasT family two-component response regulator